MIVLKIEERRNEHFLRFFEKYKYNRRSLEWGRISYGNILCDWWIICNFMDVLNDMSWIFHKVGSYLSKHYVINIFPICNLIHFLHCFSKLSNFDVYTVIGCKCFYNIVCSITDIVETCFISGMVPVLWSENLPNKRLVLHCFGIHKVPWEVWWST